MERGFVFEPDQPVEVADALAELLADGRPAVDPWWQAGIREALGETAEP